MPEYEMINNCPITISERPQPLERLLDLPLSISGEHGLNRNQQTPCHIEATNDWSAIQCWLREFEGSEQTWRSYRKEAERLLLWSLTRLNKPISSMTREDFQAYQQFLANPQPTDYWCGPRAERYSDEWRPFQGPLSASSQRQALIVVNALLSYWVDAGYLAGNPLSLIRRRKQLLTPETKEAISQERFLERDTWEALKDYIQNLPHRTPRQKAYKERVRFLFHFLYLIAPRVSEVSHATMNSFREYRGRWWWFVIGKGQKKAKVPVTEELLEALMHYRRALGLTDLPEPNDTSPLLRSLDGQTEITANMVYRIVKAVVIAAADTLQETAPHRAAKLKKASTHWFRHTSITHGDDAGVGLKYLNRSARHEKMETTAIYQHAEDDLWHDEWQKLKF